MSDTFSVNYPTISISASGPVGFCDGGKVTLTGNPSSGLKYQWRINGVDSLNKSDTLASIVAKTTGNYSLKVTNSNGCRGYSNSILVSSYPIPRADFTINDSVQCLKGNNFIFRDSSTEQPSFFLWSFGNQIFSNFKIPEDMQYNAPGTYQVYLAVTTSKGCKDTVYKTVVVFNNPSASFLISSATTQCVKANEFTVQNTSTGVLTYSWDFGNGNTSTLKDPSTTYSTSGSYTIMLAVSDSNTCTDTANKTVTVLPGPPPPVITALPDTIVCKGSPVNLAATTAFWPVWYINGSPLGKTGKNITVSTTGRYVATITDGFNCSTSSNPVNVLIKPVPPQPAVTISGNVFSSNTQLGNQWYNASGPISGETGQTFIATQSGSYYTVVTVNDCSSLPSTPLSFFPVGIHSAGGKGYDVYPNPGPGLFTIKLPVSGYTLVKLFDLTGRMVMQSSSVVEDKFIVDAGKIANGTYLMVIQTESDLFRTKVIINR